MGAHVPNFHMRMTKKLRKGRKDGKGRAGMKDGMEEERITDGKKRKQAKERSTETGMERRRGK